MAKANKRTAPDEEVQPPKRPKLPRTSKKAVKNTEPAEANETSTPDEEVQPPKKPSKLPRNSKKAVKDTEPVQDVQTNDSDVTSDPASDEVDTAVILHNIVDVIEQSSLKHSVATKEKQTATLGATAEGEQPPKAASTNTSAGTEISGSSDTTDGKDTTEAGSLDLGVEGISSALKTRILKGLEYSNAEQGLHNIGKIPHSAVWGQGANKNYVIEYGTQTRVTGWVIGRLEYKAITNNGNLLSISIKPFRTADADASNLLARRLSHPQLRADEAAYANIRVSYYKSQYGAAKSFDDLLRDATDVYDKANMPKVPLESFKLGDIVMAEVMLKKYFRKAHGQKNGDFGLSYDLQVLALLKPCSMKEHEEFMAAKEMGTAAAAQTAGAVL